MSIDREINARVEAYRDNPQALQDKYARNKELVDLLALQFIKSDLDKKKNSIAMMMQTNPATIKQQREQEVFSRTAQDVAQQLGGILQTAKNKKQMAQRRPAPQGLGALMPQQGKRPQQPQTRMMQAGGIVGFQSGGDVAEKQIRQLINMGLTDDQIREAVKDLDLLPQAAERIIDQVRAQQKEDQSLQPPQPKMRSINLTSDDPDLAKQGTQPPPPQPKTVPDPEPEPEPAPDPAKSGIAIAAKGFPKVTNEDGTRKSATQLATEMGPLTAPQIDTSKANEPGLELLRQFDMAPENLKDPEQYRKDVRDDEADFFRRDEKMQKYQDLIDRQEALNEAQSDPRDLAREQLQAGLINMAGRGSTAAGAFGAGAMTMNRSQKRDAQKRLKGIIDMVDNMEKQDLEVAKKASDVGKEALTQAAQDRRSALQAAYTMRGDEIRRLTEQAKMDYNADKDNVKTLLDASVADATRELKIAIQEGNDLQRAASILADLAIQKQKALTELEKNFKSQNAYQKAVLDAQSNDPATAADGQKRLKEFNARFAVMAQEMFRQSGADQLEADIRERLGFSAPQLRFNTNVDDGFGKMTVSP